MHPKLKSLLQTLFFLALGGVLLYLAFGDTNFNELMLEFKQVNLLYILLSVVSGYLAVLSRGYRWTLLLHSLGHRVKWTDAAHAVGVGYLVNLGVPRAGEVARCTSLYKVAKVPVDKMLGTVIVERVIDLVMMLFFFLLTIIFQYENLMNFLGATQDGMTGTEPSQQGNNFIYWGLAAVVLMALVLALLWKRIVAHPKFVKIRGFIRGIQEGFKTVFSMERKGLFIAHTLFIWLNYYFMVYICVFAMSATEALTLSDGLFIMMSASLGIVVPVPGGIGAYHYLVTLAMGILGIASQTGFAFATIVHASQTLMLIAAGLVGLLVLFVIKNKPALREKEVQ